jgi:cytochrome P450
MAAYPDISFSDPAVMRCPFPFHRQLQREAPVYLDPKTGLYEITSYALIREIAGQPKLFSNKSNRQRSRAPGLMQEMLDLYRLEGFMPVPSLLNNDPPDHRPVRSMVDKAFMPARISALRPAIQAEVDQLLSAAKAHPIFEFVADFAIPLPLHIIADQLGVPREDRKTIKAGSDALVAVADPLTPDDMILEMTRRVIAMQQLLKRRIDHARSHPDETILSVVANSDVDGVAVPMELLIHLFLSILVAGNETTTNALGNGLKMLMDRPELFELLHREPHRVQAFVEESLRWDAPLQGFYRVAVEDVEIGGVAIPKNSVLMLRWGAANHDETVFDDPERLNIDRPNISKHLTFGNGVHFCLGNLLARTELNSAFTAITQRWKNVHVVGGDAAAEPIIAFFNRGLQRLPISFELR